MVCWEDFLFSASKFENTMVINIRGGVCEERIFHVGKFPGVIFRSVILRDGGAFRTG